MIQERKNSIAGDSVSVSEEFLMWKPFFDRLNEEDPHYRVVPYPEVLQKGAEKRVRVLPLEFLIINDTVIVERSLDPQLKKGDMIVAINDVAVTDYIAYYYNDRYVAASDLQHYYKFSFSPHYRVKLIRDRQEMVVETDGVLRSELVLGLNKEDLEQKIFREARAGYITLNNFYPDNSRIIRTLSSFIRKLKKEGCHRQILDVRKNPGGQGDRFDKLMSFL